MAEGLTQAAVNILCAELTFYGAMLSMFHVMLSFALAKNSVTNAYLLNVTFY